MGKIAHASVGAELTQAEWEAADTHTINGTASLDVVRAATLIVAANGSTANEKAQADYVCDGVADDVEIQAAIDAITHGRILLLSGSYYLTSPILLNKNGIELAGLGIYVTTVVITNGSNCNAITISGSYITVRDMDLYGNNVTAGGTNTSGSGIQFASGGDSSLCQQNKIINVYAQNFGGYGFLSQTQSQANSFLFCQGKTNDIDGFRLTDRAGHMLVSCGASGNAGAGLYIEDMPEMFVVQFAADANGTYGIITQSSYNISITDPWCGSNVNVGLYISGDHINVKGGNVVGNCAGVGQEANVVLSAASHCSLAGVNIGIGSAAGYTDPDTGLKILSNVTDCTVIGCLVDNTGNDNGILFSDESTSINNVIEGNSLVATNPLVRHTVSANNIIRNNIGYIASGEIRSIAGALTAGNANAIGFSWHNPETAAIIIRKVVIEVTTGGGTVGSQLDVGIADDTSGTNRGTEFFDDLLLNSAQINDSWVAGDGGIQTKWIVCQDSASATDGWVVGQILTQNAASLVGKYYIEYTGR